MYIIQTNTSLDDINNNPVDFQSMIYPIKKQTWSEFKEYILSNEDFTEKLTKGTMLGCTKPKNAKIEEILINDDLHLEIVISNYVGKKFNSKYFKVTDEQFNMLL